VDEIVVDDFLVGVQPSPVALDAVGAGGELVRNHVRAGVDRRWSR
jgi:hypothetical protein